MTRVQFEHTIRAAGAILGVSEVLVIGSQAIHATTSEIFAEAERSIEVDVADFNDPDGTKADLIDGSIGELSIFQATFGYYAQGVTPQTAVLPTGWKERLVGYLSENTNGVTARCLEPNDLWVSKAIAGRKKDKEFCDRLLELRLVDKATLLDRLEKVPQLDKNKKSAVQKWLS